MVRHLLFVCGTRTDACAFYLREEVELWWKEKL
jgi:hypothetical protein